MYRQGRLDMHESAWYHRIGLEKDINRYRFFIFFYFSFEYLKRLQSSEMLHTKMHPTSCLFGVRTTVCMESFLPAGWWKNPPKCLLFWFGLWDVGILQMFYSPAVIQGTIVDSLAFGGKDWGFCPYKPWFEQAGGWIYLCMKRLRTLKSFKIFKTKIKKSKTYTCFWLF